MRTGLYHLIAETVALAEQEQLFGGKCFRTDGLGFAQRMTSRHGYTKRLVINCTRHDTRLGKGKGEDRHIQLSTAQQLSQAYCEIFLKV